MPLVESTCCMNCHKLLQRIVVLETKLFAGLPKQEEHRADRHHGPVMITYNIYIVIRETGQFSSKGIINDFIGNLNRLTVSRRFTEQAV